MYIKSIILDGFKSYGQRTEINGFDCEFNAITGLNGSGKSNILDAICFVLGISNLSQVRAGQLQDLVYKNGQAGVTKATVTITFDNRDREQKPPGFDDYEEITVARQVIIGGKNKYMINGSTVQNKRVQDLFCSVQLNVNNPHFLIMQGRITKVLNMKPPEILSMIEEAAGTRMYETKKQSAHKTIEKKNAKLRELDGVIFEEIKPKLQKLERERDQYLQYQKIERELEHYNNMWIAYQRISIVKNSAKSREDLQTMENNMVAKNRAIENKEQEIKSIESDIVELNQLKDKESGGILHKLEADLKSKEHVEANASAKLKSTKESITTEKKKIKQLEKTLQEDQTAYETKKSELDKVNGMFTKLRDKDTEDANALKLAQKRFEAVSVGMVLGEDGEAATLQEQLMVAKQEEVEAGTRIKQSEMQLQRSTEQLKIKESELKNSSGNFDNDKRSLAIMEKEVNQFEQQIASIEETAQQATQVMDRRRFVSNRVRELRHQTEQFERRFPHTVFMYQDPEPNFNRKRVHGVACKLFTLKDRMWATACETIAGGRLYSVIIDTDVTGKLLLQKGNLRQRTTFIPLNKIQPYVIDQKTIETAERLVGPDNVKSALSLIDYPPSLHKAMAYIFGGTFVCRDMAVAKKVAFDKRIMRRCITLDGDTVDPAGTLSGGARGEAGSLLTTLDGVKDTINELARLEQELVDLQQQERQTAATKEKYDTLQQQLVTQRHKLETTRQRLQGTSHYQKQAEIDELKKNIAELKQIITESKSKQTECKKKIKDLESQISNQHGHKDRLLKEAQNEMDKLKKQAEASQKQWKQKEQQFETLNLELSELQKTLENVQEQLVNGQKTVKELEEQLVTLQENVDKAKKEVAQVASAVKEAKHEIASHTSEIQQKIKKKDKLIQEIADIKLELQKMEHDLTKLKAEVNDSKQKEKDLLTKYDWLQKDNEYSKKAAKLTDKEANDLGHHTANLKATQKKLGRNINARVMSLLNDEEKQYTDMLKRKDKIENDKKSILKMIQSLDRKKEEAILIAWEQVNKDFGSIFGMLLPGANAKLKPIDGKSVLEGLEVKVSFGGVWKESLGELSGGQRSLVALSLILAMLLFKPAPIYILDEVDAALDLSHTQNIGNMLRTHFKHSQFVIVSLKDGMFNNANVLFRTKFVDGMSAVTRTLCKK